MKTKIYPLLWIVPALSLLPLASLAQTIRGSVHDTHSNPLGLATITARRAADSSVIAGAVSDSTGHFQLQQPSEAAFLQCSMLGYRTAIAPIAPEVAFTLEEESQELEAVRITADRVQQRPGGYDLQLVGSTLAKGKRGQEVLRMLPGLTVEDGKLQVLGQPAAAIYIDGVKVADEREVAALEGTQIESVKVDYLSGVDEAAESRGGVVRITLVKEKINGLVGSLEAGIGYPFAYGELDEKGYLRLRARVGMLSIRNIGGIENSHMHSDEHYTYEAKGTRTLREENRLRGPRLFAYDRLYLTYEIGKRNLIGASGFYSTQRDDAVTETKSLNANGQPLGTSTSRIPTSHNTLQGNANYTLTPSQGMELTLDGDYLQRDQTSSSTVTQAGINTATTRSEQHTALWKAKAAWAQQIGQIGELQVGADWRLVEYKGIDQDENTHNIHSHFRSQIPAAFVGFDAGIAKAGVRYQHLSQDMEVEGVHSRYTYGSIYPQVSGFIPISQENGILIQLQYERGMEAIPYSALSLYHDYRSPSSYTVGNPELVTPTSHQVMGVLVLFKKFILNGGYIRYSNPINFFTEPDPANPGVYRTIPRNGSYQSVVIFGAQATLEPVSFWEFKVNGMLGLHSVSSGSVQEKNQLIWKLNMDNTFQIAKGLMGGIYALYDPNIRFLNQKWNYVVEVDCYLNYTFYHDDMELRLNSIPYRHGRATTTFNPGSTIYYTNASKAEFIELSFTWRFNTNRNLKTRQAVQEVQSYQKTEGFQN